MSWMPRLGESEGLEMFLRLVECFARVPLLVSGQNLVSGMRSWDLPSSVWGLDFLAKLTCYRLGFLEDLRRWW